jgi:tetratricopeptide (TPR) repeat protein
MAICYYNLGDYTTAISEMETAIKYQPKHQIAYLNLGIVNLAAQNIEASKAWFKKTAELDPNTEAGKRAQELLSSH